MYRNIACYKNVWISRIFIHIIFASKGNSNLTLNLTYDVMCKATDNCECLLDHVKLNVHQLNMDQLYLELLIPCINTKNKKSKKQATLSLLYQPPPPHPFIATKRKKKKREFKAPYHLCYWKEPKKYKLNKHERRTWSSLAPLHLSLPQTYATRKNHKNQNKINMNEEHEVPWYPYSFHCHNKNKLGTFCTLPHKNKKQGAWSKPSPLPPHHVLSQKENKKWVKSSNLPTPYTITKNQI